MRAVFEEVIGDLAVIIVEELSKTYHLPVSQLPIHAKPGDLFEVEITASDEIKLRHALKDEQERRKEKNRLKRQVLKRRRNNLNQK